MSLNLAPDKKPQPKIVLPDIPVLAVNAKEAALLNTDGEIKIISHDQAKMQTHNRPVMVCHAPYTQQRLGTKALGGFDVLELFAFIHPAAFCVPTPVGLANALGLPPPASLEDQPVALMNIVRALLSDLQNEPRPQDGERARELKKNDPLDIAKSMGQNGNGWPWTPFVCEALGETYKPEMPVMTKVAMNVWKHLPEWSEEAPPPPPSHHPVTGEEARERLSTLLGAGAETREQQKDYATRMTAAFAPKEPDGTGDAEFAPPNVVIAEAGTGVGKTLGYLAPANVWAEKNQGSVWVSTYTKNLQRQIDQELERVFPHEDVKNSKVSVRKGRENYLCLLNFEDATAAAALSKDVRQAIAAGLIARWVEKTRDGDLQGGDFPGWLSNILGFKHTIGLSDRRGECIYSACDHYHKCFVERSIRKSKRADIVVANHALVMINTALAGADDALPQRYVFDEAHHLFDAADSAFSGHLTARETADLRRWILGVEGGKRSRARGLKKRTEDLIAGQEGDAADLLEDILHAARNLPAMGWSKRLKESNAQGATEAFLHSVYKQVFARADGAQGPYSLETDTFPLVEGVFESAQKLRSQLQALYKPMKALARALQKRLEEQAETLDSDTRKRLESVSAGVERRAEANVGAWIGMLETLIQGSDKNAAEYIDWMEIERIEGQAFDVGMYRHHIDPMKPFAAALAPHAHGIAMTSATLRDQSDDEDDDWRVARERTGAHFLTPSPQQFAVKSPFNYADQTKILVVNDINKNNLAQMASAYKALFEAAGGGALGLFTAISRLRAVHHAIAAPLEERDINVYAQHIDGMDTGTLVDIFREDTHACLLGTDAVRDGVDVPGESLRLLVYDRVPWPRPTILHKARRNEFGGRRYDEMITRLKLRQAYGRLIRRASDKGIFVMMDSGLPTRLCTAFPEDVEVQRMGLAEACNEIRDFL
jgi:ATP-dependent DNA helicase DinG